MCARWLERTPKRKCPWVPHQSGTELAGLLKGPAQSFGEQNWGRNCPLLGRVSPILLCLEGPASASALPDTPAPPCPNMLLTLEQKGEVLRVPT